MPIPLFGKSKPAGPVNWLLVGLGNYGAKYAQTRHNVGFHIVDRLAKAEGLAFDQRQKNNLVARGTIADVPVALVKPQLYMNLSGQAILPLVRFYKIPFNKILVIYDDLDLPNAQLRIRYKGGAGGHKGMKDIIRQFGTEDFPRMRIGIGRPPGRMPVEAYVLQKFRPPEWEEMQITYATALDAIRDLLQHGVEHAMNQYNQ